MEINLPDGSSKKLAPGSNGLDLAKSIGSGLAKSAVAVFVDGEQRDLLDELPDKASPRVSYNHVFAQNDLPSRCCASPSAMARGGPLKFSY